MARQSIAYQRWNPFRRPDWRHDRVLRMVEQRPNPGRTTSTDDVYVQGFRKFLLRYRAAGTDEIALDKLAFENVGIFMAYLWHLKRHDEGHYQVIMLESRILARMTDEEIAHEMGVRPEAVHWYEALFFSVREKLGTHDWILDHVLIPAYEDYFESRAVQQSRQKGKKTARAKVAAEFHPISEPFFDCTLKFFAYFAGPIMLDAMLSSFQRGRQVHSIDEIDSYHDSHQRSKMRQRSDQASLTFVVDKWNVMQLFEIHNQIVDSDRANNSASAVRDTLHSAVGLILSSTPWTISTASSQPGPSSAVAEYDEGAAELRSDEMLQVEAGRADDTIAKVKQLQLPASGRLIAQEQPAEFDPNA